MYCPVTIHSNQTNCVTVSAILFFKLSILDTGYSIIRNDPTHRPDNPMLSLNNVLGQADSDSTLLTMYADCRSKLAFWASAYGLPQPRAAAPYR